jgi:proton glutamate symport protein
MARTAVNVLGNCMATALVARWEGAKLEPASPAAALSPDPLALRAGPERSTPAG